jgi:uncharacterized protein (DUF3084 family)
MTSTIDVGHLVAQANYHLELCRSQKQYVEKRIRSIWQEYIQCRQDLMNVTSNVESAEKKVKSFYAQVVPYYEYNAMECPRITP